MFIIDFDDTLFDTHAFKQARLEAAKELGIDQEIFLETYSQARRDSAGNFTYNDRRHSQFLGMFGFDEERVFEKLSQVSNDRHKFLFNDAVDFLQTLKAYGQSMILLSLGDPGFQEFKLTGVKIRNYFNHIFMVAQSKEKVLEEIFNFEKVDTVWFINDKVDETKLLTKKFSMIKPVLKMSASITTEQYLNSGLPYFQTLNEIKDYVSRSI